MLPDGVSLGKLQGPLAALATISPHFTGMVRIDGPNGTGFLLIREGDPSAAAFEDERLTTFLSGTLAYDYLLKQSALEYELIAYTSDEAGTAWEVCRETGCLINGEEEENKAQKTGSMTTESLEQIEKQPGVVAVSVFHEGFALQSLGSADFEQVAAVAEDLVRAGTRITSDMEMGSLDQLILETPEGKVIIAPYGDLNLCVLTRPDAHLGLIRLSMRRICEERILRGE
jgi:predicted regulator of Ras-like GTPase activity (Roadblock/LC7/MglB family)